MQAAYGVHRPAASVKLSVARTFVFQNFASSEAQDDSRSVLLQASWLPKQYRSGAAFRGATRYKGAPLKLQQQLAQGVGAGAMYLPRRVGVGSSTCVMQWEVRLTVLSCVS